MLRFAVLGVGALAVTACNTIPYDPQRFTPVASNVGRSNSPIVEERSRTIANDLGLTVQSVYVQPLATTQQRDDGNEDRFTEGYVAWMDVAECERGQLVIKSDDFAVPFQAYTRYGCSLEGIPSY